MLTRIARRNLLYDRRRFVAIAAGVCFSVALVLVQLGLFAGLAENASQVIDHTPGDVWVMARNTGNFQWGQLMPRRTLSLVRSTPGVAWARDIVVGWTQLRHPDGGMQQLEVIGFDTAARVGAPWRVVAGTLDELAIPDRVAFDASAMEKVGAFRLAEHREIRDKRVRVAAITEGITSFTTVPFVFTSLATARALTGYVGPDDTVYVVAGLAPGASRTATIAALRTRLRHLDVLSREAFSTRTRRYWMFETGMGIGFLLTSSLAIAVGTVIVSQAIYAATNEHFSEYGTLKAMGMSNRHLAAIVVAQGLISGAVGALPGCLLGALVVASARARGLEAIFAPRLVVATVVVAWLACALAAATSVRRVWKLEPALVFRT
jgi:putative ABC transport system permease protein